MWLPSSRRPAVVLAILLSLGAVLFLHATYRPDSPYAVHNIWYNGYRGNLDLQRPLSQYEKQHPAVRRRVDFAREACLEDDRFEKEYGRTNLRLSRAYEGSHHRLRLFLHKLLRGESVTISAIGGSITKGHQVWDNEVWFHKFFEWVRDYGGGSSVTAVNGAAPATGSDYFSFCFPLHIPPEADLVLVELAVNDEGVLEHVENMENLLRGLLDLPNHPAVILVEALAFSNGGMGGGGGRMHLPVAQYYDVPVINQRHPLATHFGRYPQLVRPYFAQDYWGNPDMRHLNSRGHRDLGMLVASFLHDASCEMVSDIDFSVPPPPTAYPIYPPPSFDDEVKALNLGEVQAEAAVAEWQDSMILEHQSGWPVQSHYWRKPLKDDEAVSELMPGMWSMPHEYGQLPRMRVLDGWNPSLDSVVPPFHPTCRSTRAKDPQFNLTTVEADGWGHWVHPDYPDKPYLLANEPGAKVVFELDTNVGVVKMYSLRSNTFGLGMIKCWADEDEEEAVTIDGFWESSMNIGRFASIREDLSPGSHLITCEVLNATSDPGGGHEFRIISMMRCAMPPGHSFVMDPADLSV